MTQELDVYRGTVIREADPSKRMAITRISKNFQISLPKEVRDALGLRVGDTLEAVVQPGSFVLQPPILIDRDGHQLDDVVRKDIEVAEVDARCGRILGPFPTGTAALRAAKQRTHARRRT